MIINSTRDYAAAVAYRDNLLNVKESWSTPGVTDYTSIELDDFFRDVVWRPLNAALGEWEKAYRFDIKDFKDRSRPAGHHTVLGYLAQYLPETLEQMDRQAWVTSSDGKALTALMRQFGYSTVPTARACVALQRQGIERVNAYPTSVLHHYYGNENVASAA